jgi:hypothetical protein
MDSALFALTRLRNLNLLKKLFNGDVHSRIEDRGCRLN